ncbi:MAG: MFS transporter [Bacteroidota bacterium]
MCASHTLFAASFTMILPELPAYLTSLGGEDYKGLIISLFTITAGASRPFSGKLTDTVGRIPVIFIGTIVCVICSLLYPFLTTVYGFLLLRFLHGFSTGFKPIASTAYTADIVPEQRRGEAMGILGISMNTGSSISPPIGSWIAGNWSMEVMFYASSAVALLSILILLMLKETLEDRQPFHPRLLLVTKDEVIAPEAIPMAILTGLIYLSFGAMLTIVPDQTVALGMSNKGIFFTSFTGCSLLSRLVAGTASDRLGRQPVLQLAVFMMIPSLIYMGMVDSSMHLMIASGCMGFATGMAAPAVFAWTIDAAGAQRRGVALGTTYIALEIGIGLGAVLSAWLYDNDASRFGITFFWLAGSTLFAFLYLSWYRLYAAKSSP